MHLKALHLQGFKSFPDRTVIDFERGLTVIVGPNGSGKSNIADAIRWVLGEQSAKTLRGEKMEDFIFNGTAGTRKPTGFAQVTMVLDNSESILKSEYSEVSVSRRVYRSGESEYYINDTQSRLRDIVELFMDTGSGRDGYSVIGQGKIAEILSTKSAERRQIFEEAAGISRFRNEKEMNERKLEGAKLELMRLNDIYNELELRVDPLRVESEKARVYLDLREERKTLEISLWIRDINNISVETEKVEKDYNIAKSQLESVSMAVEEGEKSIERYYEDSHGEMEALEMLRMEVKENSARISSIVSDIAVLKSEFGRVGESVGEVTLSIEEKNNKTRDINSEAELLLTQVAEKNKESGMLEKEKTAALAATEKLAASIAKMSQSEQDHIRLIEEKKGQLLTVEESVNSRKESIEALELQIDADSEEIDLKKADISVEKSKADDIKKKIEELTAAFSGVENSLVGYEMKIKSRDQKLSAVREAAEKIKGEIAAKAQRANTLIDMQKHYEGYSNSVKTVMKAAERNQLSGICGPVSGLIRSPNKYVNAIETALGSASQNIVVENENDAKNSMRYLSRENAGRATFLPITSIRGRVLDVSEIRGTVQILGIASDVIEYDKKYGSVIGSLLGRTVIVEGIDEAVNTAKANEYRFRIVTLDGQVVNAGGAMTGGSLVKSAGFISRENEINTLMQEHDVLKSQLEGLNADHQKENELLALLKADYQAAVEENSKNEKSVLVLEAALERSNIIIANFDEAIITLQNRKLRNESECENIRLSINKSGERYKNILEDIERLEVVASERILKTEAVNAEMAEARNASEDLRDKINAVKSAVDVIFETVRNLNSRRIELETSVMTLNNKLVELKSSSVALAKTIEENEALLCELTEKNKIDEVKINEATTEQFSKEKETKELSLKIQELHATKEICLRDFSKLENKLSVVQSQYDILAGKLWDEYSLTHTQAVPLAVELSNISEANKRLNVIKNEMKKLGDVNVGSIEEYKEVKEKYDFLSVQISDVNVSISELYKLIENFTVKMKTLFSASFEAINTHFDESFRDLFGGGSASLSYSDPSDILNSGIDISVRLPGKITKNISELSGGEQAFVAIALYFSMLKLRPAPFCLLDEIEAALDEVNVRRFAMYLKRTFTETQFIAISHRRGTMEAADVLYGVTMQEKGVSKMLKLDVNEASKHLT